MKSRKSRPNSGFTLVEVLVALGIAGGSLVLILAANNASYRKSMGSREILRIERVAESKFEECLLGLEPMSSGDFLEVPGWRWSVGRTPTGVGRLKKLKRVAFRVYRPDGKRAFEWSGLRETRQ